VVAGLPYAAISVSDSAAILSLTSIFVFVLLFIYLKAKFKGAAGSYELQGSFRANL
jgi:hypothetical protein